ncbi:MULTISPECIES: hypothetical protein [Escherichia]|jgi:hypothetical protein|nr:MULTISPECIES: hypothetical protein [Escherichia]MCL7658870.1 hypothetical protein [Klebsiella pneumoniae]KLX54182.1 hypothetical protein SK78_03504 [Escherichia coli]MCF6530223.1 hypothetical protein [Escherichia coli]MCF6589145.1 hypothetical protein [Escherichia coli]MCK2976186.1 hypothetical protein [Escherichia coli]
MTMYTEEIKQVIKDSEGITTARDLLSDVMPTAASRFYRLSTALEKLRQEVREHFPEAKYYTVGGDGFALVLGDTHSGRNSSANHELAALISDKLHVEGGDW